MTPQDPWFFFDREFLPRAKQFALITLLFLISSLFLNAWIIAMVYEISGIAKPLQAAINYAGLILVVLAGITWWGPRISSAMLLTFIGCLHGIVVITIVETSTWGNRESYVMLLPIIGSALFITTWLYIRRKLNRAWFRFDD